MKVQYVTVKLLSIFISKMFRVLHFADGPLGHSGIEWDSQTPVH